MIEKISTAENASTKSTKKTKSKVVSGKKYYLQFVNDRDQALERILYNTRLELADLSRHAFQLITNTYLNEEAFRWRSGLHAQIQAFGEDANRIVRRMRRNVWALTVSSEAEVLHRLGLSKTTQVDSRVTSNYLQDEFEAGGQPGDRLALSLRKIVRKLENLYEQKVLKKEKLTPEDIRFAMPKIVKIGDRPIVFKTIKEADDSQTISKTKPVVIDFVDDDTWNDILDDYKEDYVPQFRGPDIDYGDSTLKRRGMEPSHRYKDVTYGWEIEQDLTHDFVQTVRLGQNEAAQKLGITDMVWIAVVDDRTDECCLWRDGLTTKEIEAELNSGKHDDEKCDQVPDGTVPPIHFNCRCRLAPATDDLPDIPESNRLDFEEWLES